MLSRETRNPQYTAIMLLHPDHLNPPPDLRRKVRADHRVDETQHVEGLVRHAALSTDADQRVDAYARELVEHLRRQRRQVGGIDALMQEYDLSSEEGVTLMCLAEALLRIPDARTQDEFIEEKLGAGDWHSHLGASEAFFVNASTFGLMMAGRLVSPRETPADAMERLLRRLGEPVIRQAVRRAMRILGRQFVLGESIEQAMSRAREDESAGYRFSYDMLGEAARTDQDAENYFHRYCHALEALGKAAAGQGPERAPGISVKLSALDPRYEFASRDRVHGILLDRLMALCELARRHGVGLCVDAEEADRLDLSLDLIETAAMEHCGGDWDGFGLAVQSYQKRAFALIDWLVDLARRANTRLLARLVKGAYWDMEIKRAQEGGFSGYPVFTRKAHTDISYLACAHRMLDAGSAFYPCFATHNARTVAALREMVGERRDFEFQRLHGMGEALYQKVLDDQEEAFACRVYAPVGGHEDLLAYLVRRLLENGANTSFVNRIADDSLPLDELVADPVERARAHGFSPHPQIRLPVQLFGTERPNSRGIDLADPPVVAQLRRDMEQADHDGWRAAPLVNGAEQDGEARDVWRPALRRARVGQVVEASAEQARAALDVAARAAPGWNGTPAGVRADTLRRAADLMEDAAPALMTLLCREAGRAVMDAHLEVREAVDFLRYYAAEAQRRFAEPVVLPGPTGETNRLYLAGRGPFLCIAPWNFPLAIFTGQVAAALAAGCPALAKPAEQTPLIAAEAVRLLHRAGVPGSVLQLLPGDGPAIGGALLGDARLAGVAFTGATDTARTIARALAAREGPMIPLIAETGGINAMIVDSTALPEQVTRDVMTSAFQSAGQRCSALRLLCIQEDVAERQLEMIAGAMQLLRLGDPAWLATDVGPIIDEAALRDLMEYREAARRRFRLIAETPRGSADEAGLFLAPAAFEIADVKQLSREVFGPLLHVVRFPGGGLDALVDQINDLGYGLTLALHSRSQSRADRVMQRARVGNFYVNRNQIGAVVGVQPFGGEGLSGTGPKAGGPHYLERFAVERAVTIDTTAAGGNASLLTIDP
jgi:RHH-type transcriptional regulator, proline utilization regulon repressor / proline dehydrogenase / delta 1-pyrroline-5-carboxylate dehydrogenase